ncbi:MAG TPA: Lpg1974 family pore-forming outer membrane protein [Gammaproteobacteria bacterium]|nr:Lpg1974 family pore-forming outer membrane protein [Gammaproteobacteria bacterium]
MKKLLLGILLIFTSLYSSTIYAAGIAPEVDILVWHVSQEPTSTWANIAQTGGSHTFTLKAPNVDFNWDVGVKIGALYEASSGLWDSGLYWTYFKAKTTSNVANSLQLVFPEFFSGFISQNFFFGGSLDWRLLMNMFDYELGHKFNVGKSFALRPFIGIKGGTIYQTINCDWNAILYTATEKVKHNFFGIGPSFGIDTTWKFYKNFSLRGDFSAALLWGNWKISDTYSRPYVPFVVDPTTITTDMHHTQLGTLMLDYFLGLAWNATKKPGLSLQIGYEVQWWTNQLRMPTFQQLPVHGDLTLQGATCRIILDF